MGGGCWSPCHWGLQMWSNIRGAGSSSPARWGATKTLQKSNCRLPKPSNSIASCSVVRFLDQAVCRTQSNNSSLDSPALSLQQQEEKQAQGTPST